MSLLDLVSQSVIRSEFEGINNDCKIPDYVYFQEYSELIALPITSLRISEVPAPISYNLASRRSLPVG